MVQKKANVICGKVSVVNESNIDWKRVPQGMEAVQVSHIFNGRWSLMSTAKYNLDGPHVKPPRLPCPKGNTRQVRLQCNRLDSFPY